MRQDTLPEQPAAPRPFGYEEGLAHEVAEALVAYLRRGVTLSDAASVVLAGLEPRIRTDLRYFGRELGELVVDGAPLGPLVLAAGRRRRKEKRTTDPTLDFLRIQAGRAAGDTSTTEWLHPVLRSLTAAGPAPGSEQLDTLSLSLAAGASWAVARGAYASLTAQAKISFGILSGMFLNLWWIFSMINPWYVGMAGPAVADAIWNGWIAVVAVGAVGLWATFSGTGRWLTRAEAETRIALELAGELSNGRGVSQAIQGFDASLAPGDAARKSLPAFGRDRGAGLVAAALALEQAGAAPVEIARWLRDRVAAEVAEAPVRVASDGALHTHVAIALCTLAFAPTLCLLGVAAAQAYAVLSGAASGPLG